MDYTQNPQGQNYGQGPINLSPDADQFTSDNRPSISAEQLHSFILFIVENIVTHKDQVKVSVSEDMPNSFTVYIAVSPEDKGRVIGKKGNTINAIRALVRVFGRILVTLQD